MPGMPSTPFARGPLVRTLEELDSDNRTDVLGRVGGARVVVADYDLLQHDFPQLRARFLLATHPHLRRLPRRRRPAAIRRIIDRWLTSRAAVVSEFQARQELVNSKIEVVDGWVLGHRPPRYGRAAVVAVRAHHQYLRGADRRRWAEEPDGLLDLKGIGVGLGIEPHHGHHGNGLLDLGDALEDLAYEWLIQEIIRFSGSAFAVVPTYALLDAGFDVLDRRRGPLPAAIQVRRAHRRHVGGADLPECHSEEQRVKLEIEMLFRSFGLTSCNPATYMTLEEENGKPLFTYAGQKVDLYSDHEIERMAQSLLGQSYREFEGINIQNSREFGVAPSTTQLVDFGHYDVRDSFEIPVVSLVRDRVLRWGGAIPPESPHFVRPDPALALPTRHWGVHHLTPEEVAAGEDPFEHGRLGPGMRAYDWARRFRERRLSAAGVLKKLRGQLATATSRWRP